MENHVEILEEKIRKYAEAYYNGIEEITDDEFDSLVEELRQLSPKSKILTSIGWGADEYGKKYPHKGLVGSLGKEKNPDNIKFDKYVISSKIDGLSVVIYYKKGKLERILTRGNGKLGRDITSKLRNKVPQEVPEYIESVRGECAMPISIFNKKYKTDIRPAPEGKFTQPRSAVVHAIGEGTDKSILKDIDVVCYKINSIIGKNLAGKGSVTKQGVNKTLKDCGFKTVKTYDFDKNFLKGKQKEDVIKENYACDGLVFSNDKISIRKEDGSFILVYDEIAYKFEDEIYDTKITGIHWSNSGGKFIPIADVTPVEIQGGMIKNVLLYNIKYIKDEGIGIGSKVGIIRANEIIPKVVKVYSKSSEINQPQKCSCGKKLVLDKYETNLVCPDDNCPAKNSDKIYDFIRLVNNDEDPIGDELISVIIEIMKPESLTDFVIKAQKLDLSKLEIEAEGIGESKKKFIINLLSKIKKEVPFQYLIKSEIDNIGTSISKMLAKFDKKWWTKKNIEEVEIERFPDRVRESLVENIILIKSWFSDINNVTFNKSSVTEVMEVAVTGALESMSRKNFEKYLELKGIALKSINKKTKYLINNDNSSNSSKCVFAKKNNIKIINEKEFFKLYGN